MLPALSNKIQGQGQETMRKIYRFRKHWSTCNESCSKVLEFVTFSSTKPLEKVFTVVRNSSTANTMWETKQAAEFHTPPHSMEQEQSKQHGSLGIPAWTNVWSGRWTGSMGFGRVQQAKEEIKMLDFTNVQKIKPAGMPCLQMKLKFGLREIKHLQGYQWSKKLH